MDADGALDVGALREELRAAVAADERHARENGAKLRAVRQRVGSYEEFRCARVSPAQPRSRGLVPGSRRSPAAPSPQSSPGSSAPARSAAVVPPRARDPTLAAAGRPGAPLRLPRCR
ncbi:coiled-coil domain-containing protein 103-like [Numida meleagris]|uniref:coiled-coil domain-containing protein 103-like n=1 Tax=Numida meleagris TaxID=8996 RepID=UPI000B3E17C1|nr:coiled-coil domain-containing protein 103-like [Numida meleagris]